jgi:hypothetical protein
MYTVDMKIYVVRAVGQTEHNSLRPWVNEAVLLKSDLDRVRLSIFFLATPRLPSPFIAQGRTVTLRRMA